jgi:hypothetical protein
MYPGGDGTKFSALTNARARIINKANAELTGTLPPGIKSGGISSNKPLPLSRYDYLSLIVELLDFVFDRAL